VPRISVITAVYNRQSTIGEAMESVLRQTGIDLEYIVVDGLSDDGTEQVVRSFGSRISTYIREADSGIYDAMNKGIRAATGEIVGFLHADDLLASPWTLAKIQQAFSQKAIDAVYGDLLYVQAASPQRIARYWQAGPWHPNHFRWGWMPPHPTVYLRRSRYQQWGLYRQDFQISADYELLVRMFHKHRLSVEYIPEVLVKMRLGGKSNASLGNRLLANREDRRAWEVNEIPVPWGLAWLKPLRKLPQYWRRPPMNGLDDHG
jgi:glycosyltransferase